MLDFPASGSSLWALYDAGGPRPEYVLPVLYSESGFNPSVVNSLGYSGVNQASAAMLDSFGIDQASYVTWPASQQISSVVAPMYRGIVARYGAINSGTRAYQGNFLPATLATAKSLSSVLATQGDAVYNANSGFDWQQTGDITVGDLAHAIAKSAASSAVQSAIAQTYDLRPGESPRDPVYGTDFPLANVNPWLVAGVLLGTGFVAAQLVREGYADDAIRWLDRETAGVRHRLLG